MVATDKEWMTPPAVAKRLGVNAEKVRGWIHSGELRAVNLSVIHL